jgi:hypothetical protein
MSAQQDDHKIEAYGTFTPPPADTIEGGEPEGPGEAAGQDDKEPAGQGEE